MYQLKILSAFDVFLLVKHEGNLLKNKLSKLPHVLLMSTNQPDNIHTDTFHGNMFIQMHFIEILPLMFIQQIEM